MLIRQRSFESFILHFIAFMLVWEWLRPLGTVGNVSNSGVFVLFLAISFLLSYFHVHWSIFLIVNFLYIVNAINQLYFSQSFFNPIWAWMLIEDILQNVAMLFRGDWLAISDAFRTLLMFILLWLLVYLLHYWIIIKKNIFTFFLLTIIYLTIIDTFFEYSASWSILRTVVFGFFALGLLAFYRLIEKEQIQVSQIVKKRWTVSLLIMLIISTSLGVIFPKAGPIWPDPIPFIQSYAEHHINNGSGEGGLNKIGYDEDDSRLGGPFIGDDTVVFYSEAPSSDYWRVETKDVYTGKGWELSEPSTILDVNENNGEFPVYSVEDQARVEESSDVTITFADNSKTHMIYPFGTQRIQFPEVVDVTYQVDMANEKVNAAFLQETEMYVSTYQKPRFEIYSLREVTDASQVDPVLLERYTQLPEELPLRVGELAQELTANSTNWYDKVRAIETYLQSFRFTYDTVNVAVPGEEDDYVDQFLFETFVGYCDNFSSSMVVLLRSLDIPARWVKGYSTGEEVGQNGNTQIYEVTNENAHSWVEVYFPGTGWVPFEPTKGFDNPADFYFDFSNRPESGESDTATPETPEPAENDPLSPDETDSSGEGSSFSLFKAIGELKEWFIGVGITIAALAVLLFIFRKNWFPYWLMFKYKHAKDNKQFTEAYLLLLKQLKWNGFILKEGETLRSFAQYVDHFMRTDDMTALTNYYERILYRNDHETNAWEQLRDKWEHLLRQIVSKN